MAKSKIDRYLPAPPVAQKLQQWAYETMQKIQLNFVTQGIASAGEVYPGYFAEQAQQPSPDFTGEGYDSFRFQVNDAATHSFRGEVVNKTVQRARVDFFYHAYLDYVDMGVGRGRPISTVHRTHDADHEARYMQWNVEGATHSTQRPAIKMEFRHQAGRLRMYFAARYKYDAQALIISRLDHLNIDLGID